MKRLALFVLGFFVGLVVVFVVFYGLGYILELFGIQLYESEADQQRNFNIYIGFSILGGFLSGYYFCKTREIT